MKQTQSVGAIILAAGKGKRMLSKTVNKVTMPLGGRPMISYAVSLLQELAIEPIVVVVGFAKKSVMQALQEYPLIYAYQQKRLGVAHAVACGLKKIPTNVVHVLVLNGDDSAFYTKKLISTLLKQHFASGAAMTFLTTRKDNPIGLGRIIRSRDGSVEKIVEEKDASEKERKIKEVNPVCYVFTTAFLKQYLPKITKSTITGEYYLTEIVNLAVQKNKKIETIESGEIPWRGVNTPEELREAELLFAQLQNIV